MAKREKIILAVMAVVVLFGVGQFFVGNSKPIDPARDTNRLNQVRELAKKVNEELNKEGLSEAEAYVLDRASAEWERDPFLGKKLTAATDPGKQEEVQEVSIIYSGYIDSGHKRLAVINGFEYEVGEELESGGYIVRTIEPDKVTLDGTGRRAKVVVPMAGEAF